MVSRLKIWGALDHRPVLLFVLALLCAGTGTASQSDDPLEFDDTPLEDVLQYPSWFKKSFLELDEDLAEAKANGKDGLIVYFGQKRCAYCRMLLEVNFQTPDIVNYTREHFDLVPIDIWSPESVTTPSGEDTSERAYAQELGTNFTPSLIFYDTDGNIALRLRGYYPPYQFRAALEYVAGGHYKREKFPVYMARGDKTLRFEPGDLVEEPFFEPPPFNLDRSHFPGQLPLVVFFEQGDCHACDILHTQPLARKTVRSMFNRLESVQLDMWSDAPVIKPDGSRSTAREWAKELGVFYAPTIVFFDEQGKEIIRIDSVVHLFRLRNVLNYVISKGYETNPDFLGWSSTSRRLAEEADQADQRQNVDR
ncbi:MAG: thioredoxin fold domain-containing protein [Chromatiaceae bacterium]|nr:thioredoxin fold domain-containing protein [Gammaproteobacteria bacterium]MCP5300299.1 thioredoxin fold domain-containing protein [Chromatiaceae bacterium]MCP5422371.1 thioredoxin fold domain-containing protein [Chromatiaceae bacterium]